MDVERGYSGKFYVLFTTIKIIKNKGGIREDDRSGAQENEPT